jgi:glycosyltransferase involved in cell wall biosynthesis
MSPSRINVLHVVLSFRPGGRRNAIATLARETRNSLGHCHLCCLDELGCRHEELDQEFDSASVLGRSIAGHLGVARRLRSLCRELEIDLIHAHDAASQFAGALVRLGRPRTRLIMTFHRSLGFESARRRDRIRNAFACWLSEAVVTASEERRSHFLSENAVAERKVMVIPLGIDTRSFTHDPEFRTRIRADLNIRPNTVVIGAVGHFGREKGVDVVLQAFAELSRRAPNLDAVLVILGDGTHRQRETTRRLAAAFPAGRVILAGYRSDISKWYSAFDVMLHAPRQEAFGLAVIEAMAANLPVVATRVGGVPELVRQGDSGFLCEPESPAALADALELLSLRPEARARFGARGCAVAMTEYDARLTAERYLKLYLTTVLGSEKSRRAAKSDFEHNSSRDLPRPGVQTCQKP